MPNKPRNLLQILEDMVDANRALAREIKALREVSRYWSMKQVTEETPKAAERQASATEKAIGALIEEEKKTRKLMKQYYEKRLGLTLQEAKSSG